MQIIDGSRLAGESKLNGKNVVVIHFKVKYIIHLLVLYIQIRLVLVDPIHQLLFKCFQNKTNLIHLDQSMYYHIL